MAWRSRRRAESQRQHLRQGPKSHAPHETSDAACESHRERCVARRRARTCRSRRGPARDAWGRGEHGARQGAELGDAPLQPRSAAGRELRLPPRDPRRHHILPRVHRAGFSRGRPRPRNAHSGTREWPRRACAGHATVERAGSTSCGPHRGRVACGGWKRQGRGGGVVVDVLRAGAGGRELTSKPRPPAPRPRPRTRAEERVREREGGRGARRERAAVVELEHEGALGRAERQGRRSRRARRRLGGRRAATLRSRWPI